ncbi:MAG: hypothetical protein KGQ79_10745 [Proteobacteria bacterium]|nr:hypothetical protein [Pseudomonadota bacterium]
MGNLKGRVTKLENSTPDIDEIFVYGGLQDSDPMDATSATIAGQTIIKRGDGEAFDDFRARCRATAKAGQAVVYGGLPR